MESAKQMLGSSSHSIKEVAHLCGFIGLVSFSRKFKQEFDCCPSQYRKNILNEKQKLWSWKIPLNENSFDMLIQLKNENKWVSKLFIIISINFDNGLFSIEVLSSKLFISTSNLNRKVKRLFGVSTLRLVRDLRLQYAAELLSLQNVSVTEVASLVGFFDTAHLSRYFKQTFGCTPGEYRNVNTCFPYIDKLLKE